MAAPPTAQDKVLYRYLTRRSSKGLGGLEPGVEPSGSLGFSFWYQKFTLGVAALGAERREELLDWGGGSMQIDGCATISAAATPQRVKRILIAS